MILKRELPEVCEKLSQEKFLSLDTETTGLEIWKNDRVFSLAIADESKEYYFNFNDYNTPHLNAVLRKEDFSHIQKILSNDNLVLYMANAKFDLAGLYKMGFEINCEIRDIQVQARLLYNDHMKYSLADCAKREGLSKSEEVEKYIEENRLWRWEEQPGKKTRSRIKYFQQVPMDIMEKYACQDARVTYQLGKLYDTQLQTISDSTPPSVANIQTVARNEYKLTKTLFHMEQVGIKIDREYCEEELESEARRAKEFAQEYERLSGRPFVDSNKSLAETFGCFGEAGGKTAKGNPRFDESALSAITSGLPGEIAKCVLGYREASKRATTYYQNFLDKADTYGKIHTNFRQSGTATGRMSATDPALQTIPKDDKVKNSFIPNDDFCFVEFDYKAMEYVLMTDLAGEQELAQKIKAGHDVHQATADLVGVDRTSAKTLNFMLLYGGGAQKLADSLKLSLADAQELKQKYFSKLPRIKKFIYAVTDTAKNRGFVFNWMGRRCHLKNEFSYKAPNYLIQGGSADIVKLAMNRCHDYLQDMKSRMILQVHDSLLFEIHKTELDIINDLKKILETAYTAKYVPMTTSCAYSWKSWGLMSDMGKDYKILNYNRI